MSTPADIFEPDMRPAPPISIRCLIEDRLTEWFEGQCQGCGFTGSCHTCGARMHGEDDLLAGYTATACSRYCADTQAAEADADLR